ncbi:polysaccharide pyruvyl transferase family protein [Flavobacterium sangjuense]|uniref:Polysaccharide pyruvyl transferase domain-containing protein n=1 Tax=Flavobacterium sangjuense TaxID=2518177 RepID=A0A4P7PVS2_9FLAO|nr:polysaccharide pyruvyl transferase family protein [Flavobacterium sangjuense]QBZ98023.1 hypothetical protein GS03_01523 [Flavobacterium sangjuense]
MAKKNRILITNAYAVNNGDMALVVALLQALKNKGYDVSIATFHYKFLKSKYPQLPLLRELLDYKLPINATFFKRFFLKLNYLVNNKYKDFEVYIGSPGGYMNSYYGLKKCLLPLVAAKKSNKKTAVYSQSIGPLNQRDTNLLSEYGKSIDMFLVRDDYSKTCAETALPSSKILQTKDAAFLLKPRKSTAKDSKLVAISVRSWKHDNRNMNLYYEMMQAISERVLENGFDVEFISTCQGVENYVDDSKTASIIKELIIKKNESYQNRVNVDSQFYSYFELVDILNSRYTFVVGTRLHMCILSLINGTPAFNISYEIKGKYCYEYLGYQDYSVDFNETMEEVSRKFDFFLNNVNDLKNSVYETVLPVHEESIESLNVFLEKMEMN